VDIYGIDGSTLDSIDMEFFFAGEHMSDPADMGKSYTTEQITRMLEDIEEYSVSTKAKMDSQGIMSTPIQDIPGQDEVVFNIVVAECMRGIVFNKIGDIVNLCVKHKDLGVSHPSVLTNIATDNEQLHCFQKFKARVVATSRKFPGFFKFSGYKQINMLCPDVVMTKGQMRVLIDSILKHFPTFESNFKKKVKTQYPPSTHDLPKSKLYVRLAEGVTR